MALPWFTGTWLHHGEEVKQASRVAADLWPEVEADANVIEGCEAYNALLHYPLQRQQHRLGSRVIGSHSNPTCLRLIRIGRSGWTGMKTADVAQSTRTADR